MPGTRTRDQIPSRRTRERGQATRSDPSVDEAELRRRIEEGLRDVRMQDVLLESVVTIVNLTARRIGKEDERDLEQARIGIEAVRSLARAARARAPDAGPKRAG